MKAELTAIERITAAYLHYCQGVNQDVISTAFLVNLGRVNEACLAIKQAAIRGKPLKEETKIEEEANGTSRTPAGPH